MVHWPGDPEFESSLAQSLEAVIPATSLSSPPARTLELTWTPPAHFMKGGVGIDQVPFDALIGPPVPHS